MPIIIVIFVLIPLVVILSLIFYRGFSKSVHFLSFSKKPNINKETPELAKNEENLDEANLDDERISVYNKIIEKANEEALKIKENGNEKALAITEKIDQETTDLINELLKEATLKDEELIKTKSAEFDQKIKQLVLANHKKLINEVLMKALNELVKMDDEMLYKFVIKYLGEISLKEDVILMVKKEEHDRYMRLFSSNKNKELDILKAALKLDVNITLSNEHPLISGGFILNSKYFDVDNSYDFIIKNYFLTLETKIASILFSSED